MSRNHLSCPLGGLRNSQAIHESFLAGRGELSTVQIKARYTLMGRQGSREAFLAKVNYIEKIVERAWRARRPGVGGGEGDALRGVQETKISETLIEKYQPG